MAKIHFLNVGHGDCTIIEHDDAKLTMIDINNGDDIDEDTWKEIVADVSPTPGVLFQRQLEAVLGKPKRQILAEAGYAVELTNPIEFLHRNYPGRPLWRYIQSHPDFDHLRGLDALVNSGVQINNFWDTDHAKTWTEENKESDRADWEAYEKLRSRGTCVFKLYRNSKGFLWNADANGQQGGHGIWVLSPTPEILATANEQGNWNNMSYVLWLTVNGRKIILGGDAEGSTWEAIHGHYGVNLKADILKASHHGRDSGYYQPAVKAIAPAFTVISVGKKPESDASQKYGQYSTNVYSTRRWGDLTVEINAQGQMNWTAAYAG